MRAGAAEDRSTAPLPVPAEAEAVVDEARFSESDLPWRATPAQPGADPIGSAAPEPLEAGMAVPAPAEPITFGEEFVEEAEDDQLPEWMLLLDDATAEEVVPEAVSGAAEPEPASAPRDLPSTASDTVAPQVAAAADAQPEPETVAAPMAETPLFGAANAVADHLEQIASRLRSRSAAELLAGAEGVDPADPLEVLITGFVLGYSQGVRYGEGGAKG